MGAQLSQHCFLAPLHAATHSLTGGGAQQEPAADDAAPAPAVGPSDVAVATPGAGLCACRSASVARTAALLTRALLR